VFIVSQVMAYDVCIKTKDKPPLKLTLRQSVVQHTLYTFESTHLFSELCRSAMKVAHVTLGSWAGLTNLWHAREIFVRNL
jgi:hypothetical protein